MHRTPGEFKTIGPHGRKHNPDLLGQGRLLEEVTSKPKPEAYIRIGHMGSFCI